MVFVKDLFSLEHTLAKEYLSRFEYPWEAIGGIADMIISVGSRLLSDEYEKISENVWVHKTAKVFPSAYIGAPCIIGANTEIRHCAYIRESALIGENCVIGNSVEVKNAIIFDDCQIPHFNYVGDSIIGHHAHMGAGAITSNVKSDKSEIIIHAENDIHTGLFKLGAMLGDHAEIGCNSVLNPGTVIGRNTNVYPLSSVRGVINENSIYKTGGIIAAKN